MSEVDKQLETAHFVFETAMRVRSTEIGVGQYLTIEAMVSLLTEARSRFLHSKGIKEINSDYQGLIITDVSTRLLNRIKAREELLFEIGVQNLTSKGGEFVFKVTQMYDNTEVARAVMGFEAYDYRQHKRIELTAQLREILDSKPVAL